MKIIDEHDAYKLTPEQLVREAHERGFTHQDYVTNMEILKQEPLSKEVFRSLYKVFDNEKVDHTPPPVTAKSNKPKTLKGLNVRKHKRFPHVDHVDAS